jgi:hypothetical protein
MLYSPTLQCRKGKEVARSKSKKHKDPAEDWAAKGFPLQDLIPFLANHLNEMGPPFLSYFLSDVLWGWERYFTQIRNDIRGVCCIPGCQGLR